MTKRIICHNLLIEIGTEEIPARFLSGAMDLFREKVCAFLRESRVHFDEPGVRTAFTPRRLALFCPDVSAVQEDRIEVLKGPPVSAALDEKGGWTQAAVSFAARNGAQPNHLIRRAAGKGEYLFLEKRSRGQGTFKILQSALPALISSVRFPKAMHWGNGRLFFARPIRWLVALYGTKVIPFRLEKISSGRATTGYRWVKTPKAAVLRADWDHYLAVLRDKGVFADFSERFNLIKDSIRETLGDSGRIHEEDESLLVELANLVELPFVGLGQFDSAFLEIPREVLATAIKHHQKYLPVYDAGGRNLTPKFIVVFNGHRDNARTVIHGNERVLRARLADASFFWTQDRKTPLDDNRNRLKHVVFLEKIGTYHDKTVRLERLSGFLRDELDLSEDLRRRLERAARLCKADLVTGMVGEFPALQGIMGREYAKLGSEDPEVCTAIYEHYLPLTGTEGDLPSGEAGGLLALCDKMDTIVAAFLAGFVPSGSQDPYGLRRMGSGLLRILYERGIPLSLSRFIQQCLQEIRSSVHLDFDEAAVFHEIQRFFKERLENLFLSRGFGHDLVRAVLERQFECPAKAYRVLKELTDSQQEVYFEKAVTVVERTYNILKGQTILNESVDESLLGENEEIELYRAYKSNYDTITRLIQDQSYGKATAEYARVFYDPVHVFFDKVLVNVEDVSLRHNRYRLLKKIHELYAAAIADLSKVARTS